MAKHKHWTEILIAKGIVGPDQLSEAEQMARQSDMTLPEALDRLGYVSGDDVAKAMAKQHGLDYINIAEVTVPPSVVELVPESVARENAILPISEEDGGLRVAISDPVRLRNLRETPLHPQ